MVFLKQQSKILIRLMLELLDALQIIYFFCENRTKTLALSLTVLKLYENRKEKEESFSLSSSIFTRKITSDNSFILHPHNIIVFLVWNCRRQQRIAILYRGQLLKNEALRFLTMFSGEISTTSQINWINFFLLLTILFLKIELSIPWRLHFNVTHFNPSTRLGNYKIIKFYFFQPTSVIKIKSMFMYGKFIKIKSTH